MRIANATNGLAYPPYEAISMFLSTHGHNFKFGYFRIDAMPYTAVVELLMGRTITIIDGTQHDKPLPDAFRYGVATWCMVFNRAIRSNMVCAPWVTPEIHKASHLRKHKPLVMRIRRLVKTFGTSQPAIIGKNVLLEVHRGISFDDKPEEVSIGGRNGQSTLS